MSLFELFLWFSSSIAFIGIFLRKKYWYVTLIIGLSILALGVFLFLTPDELSTDLTCKPTLPKNLVVCDFWESDDIGLSHPKHYQFELYRASIEQDRECGRRWICCIGLFIRPLYAYYIGRTEVFILISIVLTHRRTSDG